MKKIFSLVITLTLFALSIFGCSINQEIVCNMENVHTDYAGVYLTIVSVEKADEGQKINAVSHNETTKEVTYGYFYTIEYKNGEEWQNINKSDLNFPEVGIVLSANSAGEMSYATKYFNLGKKGTYRLRSNFSVHESEQRIVSGSTYAEFEVI